MSDIVHISLSATKRDDGSMFVVSPSHPYICVVAEDQDWDTVAAAVRKFIEVNMGEVNDFRFVKPPSASHNAMIMAEIVVGLAGLEPATRSL